VLLTLDILFNSVLFFNLRYCDTKLYWFHCVFWDRDYITLFNNDGNRGSDKEMKSKIFICYKCGNYVEAPKKSTVTCTKCGRVMWEKAEFKNEDLIREEMLLNFEEFLKND